jgi:hypothetical protein
MRGGSLNKV